MAGLKQIKSKIRSIDKTRTVTRAMEAVSAAKMRRAQGRALGGRAYAHAAVSILARVSDSPSMANHPLVRQSAQPLYVDMRNSNSPVAGPSAYQKALYIVITADRGLAGSLNSAVLRAAAIDMQNSLLPVHKVSVIAVGRKANDFFLRRNITVEAFHLNADDAISTEMMREIIDEAANRFIAKEVDVVKVVYQNFLTTFEQRPTVRQMFPLSLEELEKVVGDITPRRGLYADSTWTDTQTSMVYTIEPSEEEVLDVILPKLAGIFVYHALLESKASEHSARMVAMKNASDKGAELSHLLTLQFNKARQAAITREVSEITGGMEAMSSS